MKKIAAIAVAATAAIAVLAGFAAARFEHRDPNRAYEFITRRVDQMLTEIKATDAQKAQINQLKDKLISEAKELRRTEHGLKHDAMTAIWGASEPNPDVVHAEVDKAVEAHRAFAHDAADALIQLRGILTPEQRAQLKDKLQHRFQQRGQMSEDSGQD
jgi:Spy/CpxP family protein refolding chaperone